MKEEFIMGFYGIFNYFIGVLVGRYLLPKKKKDKQN